MREGFRLPPRSGQGSQRSGTMKPGKDCLIQAASSAWGTGSASQSMKAAGRCPHCALGMGTTKAWATAG
ncbi:hypothetical protein D3C75_1278990 [compost metagenome]